MGENELIYRDMNLSDINVVKYLLKNRYEVDRYYKETQDNCYDNAGVTGNVNQELISLLASLDCLMKEIKFTNIQTEIINLLEVGFTYSDISNMTNRDRSNIRKQFTYLCEKVVKENYKRWKKQMVGK